MKKSVKDNRTVPLSCLITQDENKKNYQEPINEKNAYNPNVGTGSVINVNPTLFTNTFLTEYTKKNGTVGVKYIEIPDEIALGHELIHAYRATKGIRKNKEYASTCYKNNNGKTYG